VDLVQVPDASLLQLAPQPADRRVVLQALQAEPDDDRAETRRPRAQPRELPPLEIVRRRVLRTAPEAAVGGCSPDQRVVRLLLARLARERRRDDDHVLLADGHRDRLRALGRLDLLGVLRDQLGQRIQVARPRDDAITFRAASSATSTSRFFLSRSTSAGPVSALTYTAPDDPVAVLRQHGRRRQPLQAAADAPDVVRQVTAQRVRDDLGAADEVAVFLLVLADARDRRAPWCRARRSNRCRRWPGRESASGSDPGWSGE
jgi:hypothetical protein